MNYFKKNRKTILTVIMYLALFLIGYNIFSLSEKGIDPNKNMVVQFSALVGNILLALGCFWELYFAKREK